METPMNCKWNRVMTVVATLACSLWPANMGYAQTRKPTILLVQGRTGGLNRGRAADPALIAEKWKSNRLLSSALAHSVVVTPTGAIPGSDGRTSELLGLLRKQSTIARTILAPQSSPTSTGGVRQTGVSQSGVQLNGPAAAPRQTMSAPGSELIPAGSLDTASKAQSGSTPHQPADSPQIIGKGAPSTPQVCLAGIGSVDGQSSGVWFSPVGGEEGRFVIQGCGFGTTPGQVYLTGIHSGAPASAHSSRAALGSPVFRDRVSFSIAPGGWSDRQIIAQIDPNAGGFYDTNNVTLVVRTASGQQYQAGGMNFLAAREDQVLNLLPKPAMCAQSSGYSCVPLGVNLVTVSAPVVGPVKPEVESPSLALLEPGETIAVARETTTLQFPIPANPGLSFSGGTDTYQFHFAPGFQLDPHSGVQLRHATPDAGYCQSVKGVPSRSGNWSVTYTSTSSFQVGWQTDGCWPNSTMTSGNSLDFLNYASVSVYELQITVLGPRGVSPWATGNMGSGLTKAPQPSPVLLKQ